MKKIILGALAALCAISCCNGNYLKQVRPERMGMSSERLALADGIIEQAIADSIAPGMVLAVVREDKLVYLKAYGNKQVVPEVEPMTVDGIFDLASLSKCVGTTMSFMQLIDDGKVRLTDDVDRYIEGFEPWVDPESEYGKAYLIKHDSEIHGTPLPKNFEMPRREEGNVDWVTVQDLLTHSSGLPAYLSVARCNERFGGLDDTPDSTMHYIATELPRTFRPGTNFRYSCLNFVTLQNILQNVTGQKLCDYAKEHVFDVLGMKNTCYFPIGCDIDPEVYKNIVPTEVQADGLPYRGQVHDPIANILNYGNSGNAGVFSCAKDLAILAAAIMNGGEHNGHRILSPMMIERMSAVPEDNAPEIGRALGWDNYSDYASNRGDIFSRHRTLGHTGYTGTSMIIDLDAKTAVILLSNRVHPLDKGSMVRTRALVANVVASSILE